MGRREALAQGEGDFHEMRRAGFTMIEMLAAILILSVMTIVTGVTFTSVINSWKKATLVAERMQTVDYALNQVVAGLRSAYYPPDGNQKDEWGFALIDGGDGESASESDMIEWTKLGNAIVGDKSTLGETSHRVRMWVEDSRSRDEPGGLWVRVWNADLIDTEDPDFDEDEYGQEFLLVEDVIGFDCKVQKDSKEVETDGRPKWEEEWATSNQIPYRVKIAFRMKPPEKGDDPLPVLRVVEMPLSAYSQNPFSPDSKDGGGKGSKDGKSGGGKSDGGNGGSSSGDGGGTSPGGGRGPSAGGGSAVAPGGGGGGGMAP